MVTILADPGDLKHCIARSFCRVGWCEFCAWLFRCVLWRYFTLSHQLTMGHPVAPRG